MIKGQQIEDLVQHGCHYITAITKPQIEKLLRTGTFQMDLFDQELAEVLADEGIRYVLRRNPVRAQEVQDTRQAKLATLQALVAKYNQYLTEHPRADAPGALQKLVARATTLRLSELYKGAFATPICMEPTLKGSRFSRSMLLWYR